VLISMSVVIMNVHLMTQCDRNWIEWWINWIWHSFLRDKLKLCLTQPRTAHNRIIERKSDPRLTWLWSRAGVNVALALGKSYASLALDFLSISGLVLFENIQMV
jgi:hypothetical protein